MKRFLLLILFIPCVWATDPVTIGTPTVASQQPAATIENTSNTAQKTTLVNKAQVPVVDESPQALELGLQAAFSEVMIKSTGNPNIMQASSVVSVSKNVSQIVQGYSYTQIGNATPPTKPQTMLNVTFDPNAISQLIELVNQNTQNNNAPTQPIPSNVVLLVTGVKNMTDYAALTQSLRETANVTNVAVNNVDPDRISLTITVNGGAPALKAGLVSNTHLRALETTATEANAPLFYLWVSQP